MAMLPHPELPITRRLDAADSEQVRAVCDDILKSGGTVLGITPNMDRIANRGFAMNYTNEPAYWVFAILKETG